MSNKQNENLIIGKSPILGFIRYSCRATFSSNKFFHPKYLDYRLNLFRNITLKSLLAQTEKDFNILLLHSSSLPSEYKEIFNNMAHEHSFLHNIYIPDSELEGKDYITAVMGSIEYINFYNNTSINFRIDNDDALPCNFIVKLKYYLNPEFINHVISIPHVSIIQRTRENKFLVQGKYLPSNSIGLAFVTGKSSYKTIMTLGDHGRVNQKYPMILLPGNGGIQAIHGNNIMNSLYFGRTHSYDEKSLLMFLNDNSYSNHDFKCLNIHKRHQIINVIIKSYNYLKKQKQIKKNVCN